MQDIRRQLGIAIRWLPVILVGALVAGVIAYSITSSQPAIYQATTTMRVDPGPDPSSQDWDVAEGAAIRYAEQAVSRPVVQAALERQGMELGDVSVEEQISTDVDPDTYEVAFTVRDEDPETARALAIALAAEMRSRVRDLLITDQVKRVSESISTNRQSIRTLENRLRFLRRKQNKTAEDRSEIISLTGQISSLQRDIQFYQEDSRAYVRNLLQWVERPAVPEVPVEPRPLYWTLLAVVAGGMLAAGLAFVLEYLRSVGKINEDRDLELATGQVTLGEVMESARDARRTGTDRLAMLHYPRSKQAEAYRGLIARAGFFNGVSRTIMVVSPTANDAKSVVAANIAVAYAEAGRNVILVDADYRTPSVHNLFAVSNERGLTSILHDSNTPLGWATVPSAHPRLGLMPAGPMPHETAEPLGVRQLNALLRRLLQAADLVVFNSPPIASNLDAATLAAETDGAILVVPRQSKEEETVEAATALQTASVEFLGAVLYRRMRRSRKGARVNVPPAPKGWGPTWPMLYEQPAQIPASAPAAAQNRPATQRPAQPPATAAQPPRPSGLASRPYGVPFAAQPPTQATTASPANPAAAGPVGSASPTANPAAPASTAAPIPAADPATPRAQATPEPHAPRGSSADAERVSIPVEPDEAGEPRSETTAAGPVTGATDGQPQRPMRTRPETIPG